MSSSFIPVVWIVGGVRLIELRTHLLTHMRQPLPVSNVVFWPENRQSSNEVISDNNAPRFSLKAVACLSSLALTIIFTNEIYFRPLHSAACGISLFSR